MNELKPIASVVIVALAVIFLYPSTPTEGDAQEVISTSSPAKGGISTTATNSKSPSVGISWVTLEEARKSGKPIWVHFTDTSCGPCRVLRDFVFTKEDVILESRTFACVRENVRGTLGRKWQIKSVPWDVFIRQDWKHTYSGISAPPSSFKEYLREQATKLHKGDDMKTLVTALMSTALFLGTANATADCTTGSCAVRQPVRAVAAPVRSVLKKVRSRVASGIERRQGRRQERRASRRACR